MAATDLQHQRSGDNLRKDNQHTVAPTLDGHGVSPIPLRWSCMLGGGRGGEGGGGDGGGGVVVVAVVVVVVLVVPTQIETPRRS